MPIINMTIRRKKISSPQTHLVCGNTDYQIAFNFDSEWSEYDTKTARFYHNGAYTDVVFTGYLCDVPKITNADFLEVGVFAGDLRTTTPGRIECDRSILCRGGSPAEPEADVYAQLMELLNSLVNFSVPPSTIAAAVEEYMAANPLKETDPTVPAWAKKSEKPQYTADEVGAISLEKLNQAAESILAHAKASGVFDGAPGKDGDPGKNGTPGKTAYEYAKEGGYTGTEEEFREKMAQEIPKLATPDLDQNDPDQPDYVKGRTHWREPKYKDTFPETQVAFAGVSELVDLGSGKALVDGGTYFVTWNGETYQVKASVFAESGEVYVGDWDHVRYPFFVENSGPTRLYVSKATSTIETVTLKIQQQDGWVYHPFQADYLPLGVPYAEHVDEVVLPECSCDSDGVGYVYGDHAWSLTEGWVYDVMWNGTLYRCPAVAEGTTVKLKQAYVEGTELLTAAPFQQFYPPPAGPTAVDGKMVCGVLVTPKQKAGTVSVVGYTKVQKIAPISLPNQPNVFTVDFVLEYDFDLDDFILIPQPDHQTAHEQCAAALEAGKLIVARILGSNGGYYQLSYHPTDTRSWYFTRVDMANTSAPVLEVLHWDTEKTNQTSSVTKVPVQTQITGEADQFVVIGEDGKPVAKELDLGGGLVVVKATDSGKANYSSTEIKNLYESGHTVVFETEDSTGNKVVYQLRGVRPVRALFEYHDGSTEKEDYHKSVYVDSNKLITFANTIIPVVKKTSDLENDVPFVSAGGKQELTEAQQQQARDNIGAVKSWNDLEGKPFGEQAIYLHSGPMNLEYEEGMGAAALLTIPDGKGYEIKTIRVLWNGTPYDCEMVVNADFGIVYFGNLGPMGMEDTGEPFVIQCGENEWFIFDLTATEGYTVNVDISYSGIIKLPDTFNPGPIFLGVYSEGATGDEAKYLYRPNTEFTTESRLTLEELKRYVTSGRCLWLSAGPSYLRGIALIDMSDEYGTVREAQTVGSQRVFYTAEYTPET